MDEEQNSAGHMINFVEQTNLPYVNVTIEGQKVKTLLDTGASISVMSKRLFDRLKNTDRGVQLEPTSIQLRGPNSQELYMYGECSIDLSLGNYHYPLNAIVSDISPDMIIGSPFIKSNGIQIDLRNNVLTCPDSGESISINCIV